MYWRHFDLKAEPFSLTPDPAFLYLSAVHAEAYAALTVGLRERRGLIAMIGEVGTGKTTLVYSLLSGLGPEIHTAYISNARLSFDGILRTALRDFGVVCESVHLSDLLDAFNRFLLRCAEDGTTAALVIDEAQNLSQETFEDLRLLTNFETYKHKLLQIVLVGQPELDAKLRDPALRQVTDRIAVRCHVNPLKPEEVRRYIEHRLAAVGGSSQTFTEGALRVLVRHSRGIPRSINVLGHNAMLFAYGSKHPRVTRDDVLTAIREREGLGLVQMRRRRWLGYGREFGNGSRLRFYLRLILAGSIAALAIIAVRASNVSLAGLVDALRTHAPAIGAPESTPPNAGDAHDSNVASPSSAAGEVIAPRPSRPQQPASRASDEELAAAAPPDNEPGEDMEPEAAVSRPEVQPAEPETPAPEGREADEIVSGAPAEPPAASTSVGSAKESRAAAQTSPQQPGSRAGSRTVARASADRRGGQAETRSTTGAGGSRHVQVTPGSSLSDLMKSVYGKYDPRDLPRIQALNPQVRDPNRIVAGDELRFPEQSAEPATQGDR